MSRTAICPRKTADSRKRTADRLATRPPRLLYCGAAKRPCGTALPYRGRRASSARCNLLPGRAGRFPSLRPLAAVLLLPTLMSLLYSTIVHEHLSFQSETCLDRLEYLHFDESISPGGAGCAASL